MEMETEIKVIRVLATHLSHLCLQTATGVMRFRGTCGTIIQKPSQIVNLRHQSSLISKGISFPADDNADPILNINEL